MDMPKPLIACVIGVCRAKDIGDVLFLLFIVMIAVLCLCLMQDLPVTLPTDVTFGDNGNPLANHPSWKHTQCPTCAKTSDTRNRYF